MAVRWITRGCIAVFVCGIAGLIISSIAGNNNGVVLSIGSLIGLAAVVLIVTSTVSTSARGRDRIDAFVEADAERLEQQIQSLVAAGADEAAVRSLVRDAMRLDRR